ncbi:C39 family peptidase [Marinobacterium jannaschii]|uniref:C39 family peptidase n=1 Tax=Marinobacterium jannaschii TaxID=64970 RepID=UPI000566A221|nr:C39 family peptidase [Marinobacterium jannaschii]
MNRVTRTLVLLVSLSCSLPAISYAAPFGHLAPGMGVQERKIQSMQGRKYANLIRQQTDFSCGAAALATIMKYAYRLEVDEQKVLQGLFAVSDPDVVLKRGFSLLNIKQYVEALGMRGRGYQVNMDTLNNLKIPTIILLDLNGYKHFVVLKKSDTDKVYVSDPALGNKIIDKKDFVNQWNGIVFAVIGPGFDRNSVLLNPPPPLTARNLHNINAPVSDMDLLDFGFRYSELF